MEYSGVARRASSNNLASLATVLAEIQQEGNSQRAASTGRTDTKLMNQRISAAPDFETQKKQELAMSARQQDCQLSRIAQLIPHHLLYSESSEDCYSPMPL